MAFPTEWCGRGHGVLGPVVAPLRNREAEPWYKPQILGRQICLTNYFIWPCARLLVPDVR